MWKLWTIHKNQAKYLRDYERGPETAWRLLERAAEVEGGFESLLIRLTQERALKDDDIDHLARFREAYQCLRESIRIDVPLDWKANPFKGESAVKYREFKRLASYVANLLSHTDTRIILWRAAPSPPIDATENALY